MNHCWRHRILLIVALILCVSCEVDVPITVEVEECQNTWIDNTHSIEGYTNEISYQAGDEVQVMVHTLADFYDITFIRHGLQDSIVAQITGLQGQQQNYLDCAYRNGCNWAPSYSFTVPAGWRTGMYSAELVDTNGDQFNITFVIRGETNAPADFVVMASTNTWQAYNRWGGVSFYFLEDKSRSSAWVHHERPNPYARPYGNDGHLANAELHLLRWLEANGYDYDLYADQDLHKNPNLLLNYKALLISTHSEYWSKPMMDGMIDYLQAGGNLAYLSGNGLYRRVSFNGNQMEGHLNGANHLHDGIVGGEWRELGFPESWWLGVQYDTRGYDTYAPYEVLAPNHWIFNNTNVQAGDSIGNYSLNDGAASGHETDKITNYSPDNLVHLAKGMNPNNGGADMIYYERSEGGGVFSAGSITFCGALPVDPVISQMLKNVLDFYLTN